MNRLIEKIEAPLKENPDLSNPQKGSYHDGYRSATINILAIIKAENLAIADVGGRSEQSYCLTENCNGEIKEGECNKCGFTQDFTGQ